MNYTYVGMNIYKSRERKCIKKLSLLFEACDFMNDHLVDRFSVS
jgi:hypothetical protein